MLSRYFLLITFILAGCTQSGSDNYFEEVVNLEAKSVILSGTTDFGSFETTGATKMVTFQITNSGTESLNGPLSWITL